MLSLYCLFFFIICFFYLKDVANKIVKHTHDKERKSGQ